MSKMRNNSRDSTQENAVDLLMTHKKGTIILPTGYGKTKVGHMLWEKLDCPEDVLVISSKLPILEQ